MQSRGTARTPLPKVRWLHLRALQTSHNSSMRQSLSGHGTQPTNQPTNQSLSLPYLVQGDLRAILWPSQGPHLDFKIVSVSIFHCYSLGVCYRAYQCGQTQEMANRQGDVDATQLPLWLCFKRKHSALAEPKRLFYTHCNL